MSDNIDEFISKFDVCNSYEIKNYLPPLVSVVVITYRSAHYVRKTLDSVLNQDYDNLELIISDDCSPDNTMEIVSNWIQDNQVKINLRNLKLKVVTTDQNGGICHNYNNGLKYAHGKWIKYIAGDDILEPDCISTFVNYASQCNDKLFICGTKPFTDSGRKLPQRLLPSEWFSGDCKSQEKLIVKKGTIIEGPTLFIDREVLESLGGFEEKYPFIEDYPLCMKFLKNGYRINLVPHHLIRYREYPESVSRGDPRFATSIFHAIEDYAIPAAWKNRQYLYWWHEFTQKSIRHRCFPKILLYLMSGIDLINWRKKFFKK